MRKNCETKLVYKIGEKTFEYLFGCFTEKIKMKQTTHEINNNFVLVDNMCEAIFTKQKKPNWIKTVCYVVDDKNIEYNTSTYRIFIYKVNEDVLYLEINGSLKIFDGILDKHKHDFRIGKIRLSRKLNVQNIRTEIERQMVFVNREEMLVGIDKKLRDEYRRIAQSSDVSYTGYISLYNDLRENKRIDDDKKLDAYVKSECMDGKKSSETKYNTLICQRYRDRYKNLDRTDNQSNGCEIADIFDIPNSLLFHNKKNDGSLRVLASQVANSSLYLKSNYSNAFKAKHCIPEDFKFVFGLILTKENVTDVHKLAIGQTCDILRLQGIEYFVDYIEHRN